MIKKALHFLKNKRLVKKAESNAPIMLYTFKLNGAVIPNTRVGSSSAFVGKEGLSLAENVFIGQFNFIEASNGIKIEEGVQITNYISILSHSSHDSIRLYGKEYRTHKELKGYQKGTVSIGKYSFIGPHSTLMPNTKIGKGSIVSAYSFVSGSFPDFSIIAGNPAKVVGSTKERDQELLKRFPELQTFYAAWVNE